MLSQALAERVLLRQGRAQLRRLALGRAHALVDHGANLDLARHGGGEINRFVVDKGISLDVAVNKGEAVLSSGLEDAVLPPDVPIGLVDRVTPNDAERTQQLLVRYAVDFSQLDVLQVVRWVPPR